MRRASRIDDNQHEIVDTFRALGFSVAITSMVGNGFPDVVLGFCEYNYLVEIKDGRKSPSARILTEPEKKFWKNWKGNLYLVESVQDAKALGEFLIHKLGE